jgi:plastocyanin
MRTHATSSLALAACVAAALLAPAGCSNSSANGPAADVTAALKLREDLKGGAAAGATATVDAGPTGTGWATLKGSFKLDGDAPPRRKLAISGGDMCSADGSPLLGDELLIDPSTKGIGGVVIFARKPKRVHDSAKAPKDPEVVFDQKGCRFLSHVAGMQVGQTMKILNSDPFGHNTKIDGVVDANKFNQTVATGTSVTYTPKREENAPLKVGCSIHPWMSANVLVRGDGYFAVTGPDGTFEIPNLPAGEELELQVWHEAAGGQGNLVLEQPALKWNKQGRFKMTLQPDEVRTLDLTVPVAALPAAG